MNCTLVLATGGSKTLKSVLISNSPLSFSFLSNNMYCLRKEIIIFYLLELASSGDKQGVILSNKIYILQRKRFYLHEPCKLRPELEVEPAVEDGVVAGGGHGDDV